MPNLVQVVLFVEAAMTLAVIAVSVIAAGLAASAILGSRTIKTSTKLLVAGAMWVLASIVFTLLLILGQAAGK